MPLAIQASLDLSTNSGVIAHRGRPTAAALAAGQFCRLLPRPPRPQRRLRSTEAGLIAFPVEKNCAEFIHRIRLGNGTPPAAPNLAILVGYYLRTVAFGYMHAFIDFHRLREGSIVKAFSTSPANNLPEFTVPDRLRSVVLPIIEIGLLVCWTWLFASGLLDFSSNALPYGSELMNETSSNWAWDDFKECGLCALWNGYQNGGFPTLADPMTPVLHPMLAIPALLFGALNGIKATLWLALLVGGIGQWWLSRELGLGILARLWSGAITISSGNLAGRIDGGVVALLVSLAAYIILLPTLCIFMKNPSRRSAALLGLAGGGFLISGQQYLQMGAVMLSPLLLLFAWTERKRLNSFLSHGILAISIAILTSSLFLLSISSFFGKLEKYQDPYFARSQPMKWIPINLVLDDWGFYQTDALHKVVFPYMHVTYIGWIAVVFAVFGVAVAWHRQPTVTAIGIGVIVGSWWIASADPFKRLYEAANGHPSIQAFAAGMASTPLIAALAVPIIIAFGAIGLDRLTNKACALARSHSQPRPPLARYLGMVALLLLVLMSTLSVRQTEAFTERTTILRSWDLTETDDVFALLETDDLQWVQTVWGEGFWSIWSRQHHLKVSWFWDSWLKDTSPPPAQLEAVRGPDPPEWADHVIGTVGDMTVYSRTGTWYAVATLDDGSIMPCHASGWGATLEISCDLTAPGHLRVYETNVPGWNATVSGQRVPVTRDDGWIGIEVPAGASTTKLQYRPWEFWVGAALTILGAILALTCLLLPARYHLRVRFAGLRSLSTLRQNEAAG